MPDKRPRKYSLQRLPSAGDSYTIYQEILSPYENRSFINANKEPTIGLFS
jgi:hypothetical protein